MEIPLDRLTITSSRSGGPGGQNVNKVATKVEIRFRVADADWLPPRVRRRLADLKRRRVNREGELVIVSSRHRSKKQNLEDCLEKLRRYIAEASRRPRPRVPTVPTAASRRQRLEGKRRRAQVKRARQKPGAGDDG